MQTLTFARLRGCRLLCVVLALVLGLTATHAPARAEVRVLDGFETVGSWKVITSEAVVMSISVEPGGVNGRCLRIDYDFTRGSGYGIVRRDFDTPLPLPANYRFSYAIRGEGPSNTFEFKLIDESGDNVWWHNHQNFEFPKDWRSISLPKRKISFAWGPAGGATPLGAAKSFEMVVTSYNGGKGTVWVDELGFEELPEARELTELARVKASSSSGEERTPRVVGEDGQCAWQSAEASADPSPWIMVEYSEPVQIGGLSLRWDESGQPAIEVQISDGRTPLRTVASLSRSGQRATAIALPDAVVQSVRVVVVDMEREATARVGLEKFKLMPLEFGDSANNLVSQLAKDTERGQYPRQFLGEASYWTIIGARGSEHEALMSEDGAVEFRKGMASIEPFLHVFTGSRRVDCKPYTWKCDWENQELLDGYLPCPRVYSSRINVQAVADDTKNGSVLLLKYTLHTDNGTRGLYLATRPFQVNPLYQWLNTQGGVGSIRAITYADGVLDVDGYRTRYLVKPEHVRLYRFAEGESVHHAMLNQPDTEQTISDAQSLASALAYFPNMMNSTGEDYTIPVVIGLDGQDPGFNNPDQAANIAEFNRRFDDACQRWRQDLNRVSITLPKSQQKLADSVRANLAYILINRDGAAIHPGSRSYERAWIRDGSLTSAALMSFGFEKEAMEFADWFGPNQYDNGKVPCCVDRRGPDPVAEHDSHGQYIWLVYNVFRHTGDSDFLARHYPRVLKAIEYMEFLRLQRSTEEYVQASGLKRAMLGMMPESISHEGYSAKPMHSYWDAYFAARGYADAASIASLMGDAANAERLATLRDGFREALVSSITLAMSEKAIDYLPGCVELGDFDATSTTVALWPCALRSVLPEAALQRTFEKYWEFFQARAGGQGWENYTPYEHRTVGSMFILGHRERGHAIWDWFFKHQRPQGWRHWAEVVWNNERTPKFIGDMPHTWVGSDYINAFRTMFVYERVDGAVVLGAGLLREWAAEGAGIDRLRTPWGELTLTMKSSDEPFGSVGFDIKGLTAPAGGVYLAPPNPAQIASVRANGEEMALDASGLVRLSTLPARVEVRYKAKID